MKKHFYLPILLLILTSVCCTAMPYSEQEVTQFVVENTPIPVETTSPTDVPELFTELEKEYLINLCIIEVRDFKDMTLRKQACYSVISAVMTRVETGILSDGTIRGTLIWNCFEDSEWCQFPAYVVTTAENNGVCGDGLIPEACPYFYDREWAEEAINEYIFMTEDEIMCPGYIYYGIKSHDTPECEISEETGIFVNFHGSS